MTEVHDAVEPQQGSNSTVCGPLAGDGTTTCAWSAPANGAIVLNVWPGSCERYTVRTTGALYDAVSLVALGTPSIVASGEDAFDLCVDADGAVTLQPA